MTYIILIIIVLFLAYANGANDNFKGVATLFGSGTTNYKGAIGWATITTAMGSVASLFLAQTLVKNFSGKGLLPDAVIGTPEFAIAIALGAALTIMLASIIGMPISTTHSLVGALVGSGLIAVGSEFNFIKLGGVFFLPLILSPFMAAGLSFLAYWSFSKIRLKTKVTKETCICVGEKPNELIPQQAGNTAGLALLTSTQVGVTLGTNTQCHDQHYGKILGINLEKLLNHAHYLSAGIVSFSRGLNDTPKIVGLLLVLNIMNIQIGITAVAIAIAAGGLLNAKKVAKTMSNKITKMNPGQGFTANLITGLLVTTASIHGMPVSTTHVSVGSLFGIGSVTKNTNLKVISQILFSWLLTLPIAALLSGIVYWTLIQLI
ncbi:MAG: inorganic phosphate transporter [Bacteroidetes bacterium]|nr:inorganic phosphate transporter [Bacteroidota bacterium]